MFLKNNYLLMEDTVALSEHHDSLMENAVPLMEETNNNVSLMENTVPLMEETNNNVSLMENTVPLMEETNNNVSLSENTVPLMEETNNNKPLSEEVSLSEKQNYNKTINELYDEAESFKWSLLKKLQQYHGKQKIDFIEGVLFVNDRRVTSFETMIASIISMPDKNQNDSGLLGYIMPFIEALPVFKNISTNIRIQAASAFVSLIGHIYALFSDYEDPIMWATQICGIVGVFCSLISMVQVISDLDMPGLPKETTTIDPIEIVKGAVTLYSSEYFREKLAVQHSCRACRTEPISCEGLIDSKGWEQFMEQLEKDYGSTNVTIHDPDKGDWSYDPSEKFIGCMIPSEEGYDFYPADQNQDLTSLIESPYLSGIVGLLYGGLIFVLTKSGFTTAKEFLEFSRIKDAIIKSTHEAKDFMKFIAEDICQIKNKSTTAAFKALSNQHDINVDLQMKPVTWFCEDISNAYLIKNAILTSKDLLSVTKTDASNRTSIGSMINLLTQSVTALVELQRKVFEKLRTMEGRPDVVVIHLWGEGGVGKTELTKKKLIPMIAKKLGISPAVYNINLPKNGHWPSYAGQKIAVYDEYGNTGAEDPIIDQLNGVCSSGYFSMNGAELVDKPQPCAIRVLILISNQPRWNLTKRLQPSVVPAYWSRHNTIEVKWDGYRAAQRQTRTGRRPDFSHLRFFQQSFEDVDNKFEPVTSKELKLEAIVELAASMYQEHEKQHLKNEPADISQSFSGPLVINLTGKPDTGKTWAVKGMLTRLTSFTKLPSVYITSRTEMKARDQRTIYVLDDILVSDSSHDLVQEYVSFYNSVVPGSMIILISNMDFTRSTTLAKCGFLPILCKYLRLQGAYWKNQAVVRRLGLEGWILNETGYFYEETSNTEFQMRDQKFWTGVKEQKSYSFTEFFTVIVDSYQKYLQSLGEYILEEVTTPISKHNLENHIQFKGMTLEELSRIVKKGGIEVLMAIKAGNIIIPPAIFNQYDPSYPIANFEFSTDPEVILEQLPRLMTTLRNTTPTAEVYLSCGAFELRTEKQRIMFKRPFEGGIETTVDLISDRGDHFVEIRTMCEYAELIDRVPAHDVFRWIKGSVQSLPVAYLNTRQYEMIEEKFKQTPLYAQMEADYVRAVRRAELESFKVKWMPIVINYLEKIPVIKVLLGICVIATSTLVVKQIMSFFARDIDQRKRRNRNKNRQAVVDFGRQGGSNPCPDVTSEKYAMFPGSNKNVTHVCKEAEGLVDFDLYEKDLQVYYDRLNKRDRAQMFKSVLNVNPLPFDQVVDALHKASVHVSSDVGALVGHMIYQNIGLTNAHIATTSYAKNKEGKSLTEYLADLRLDVEQEGKWYKARPIRVSLKMDCMLFEIQEKQFPAAKDIRHLFLTNDIAKPHLNYAGALIKYRSENVVVEKCNIEYAVNSPVYFSQPSGTGVMSHAIMPTFITTERGVNTKEGDCGSFYVLTEETPTQNQHARILGMHVGLRRGTFPHGTTFSPAFLYGFQQGAESQNQSLQRLCDLDDPNYGGQGKEMVCDYITELMSTAEKEDHPFDGTTIEVIGHCSQVYVKPLEPNRIPTGFARHVEEEFGHTSEMVPTATNHRNMDLSDVLVVNGRPDILSSQFKPYGEKLGEVDESILNEVVEFLEKRYNMIYTAGKGPISFDEAVNGFKEGHPLYGQMNRLNLDASAGPYFKKRYNITKKKEFFELKNDRWELRDTPAAHNFKERSLFILDHLLNGVAYQTLTQVCLKAELRPVEKVRKGVIRTFDNTDASTVMAHRMLLMHSIIAFQNPTARLKGGPQIGQNALLDFPGYYQRFQGKKLLQFDFSQYDRRLHPKIIAQAYYLALRTQKMKKEEAKDVANALMIQTCHSYKIVGNTLCRTHQGISSGMLFTSLGDSICNEIMLYYCLVKAMKVSPKWVSEKVDAIMLGDDITSGYTEAAYNMPDLLPKLLKEYTDLGMVVTSADKKSEIRFETVDEFAFCSRTIRITESGKVVCPLKRRTILALLEWVSPTKNGPVVNINGVSTTWTMNHQIVTQINEALMEASMYSSTQFKRFYRVIKRIADDLKARRVPQAIINEIDWRTHKYRTIYTENLIDGRNSLNNSLKFITRSDQQQINMSQEKQSIVLVEEWCNHHKLPKPEVIRHTLPEPTQGVDSKCILRINWNGLEKDYQGVGPNKRESKRKAFELLVLDNNITPLLSSDTLKKFCKQSMIARDVVEFSSHHGGNFNVFVIDRTSHIYTMGRDPNSLSTAQYNARRAYYLKYQALELEDVVPLTSPNKSCILEESWCPESDWRPKSCSCIERVAAEIEYEASQRLFGHDMDQMDPAPVGMTMNATSASAPPAPVGITPASGAMPEPQAEPTALINLPEGLLELENINQPPDMLPFGGVDFDLKDLVYRQCIDHVADKPINQNVPRGTILLVQSYDPMRLNAYIQQWMALHTRFVGPLIFRMKVIGNPIFMGEVAWAWVPDARKLREGDIIPDIEYQKYLWVTFEVNKSWSKTFALADARKQTFWRTTDTITEDLTEQRPGFVLVMYRAVVNPFNNPEAACYVNVGSYLAQMFRVADPMLSTNTIRPDDIQTDANNSLNNKTFGTVFSEFGGIDSSSLFMATDGRQYPVIGAPLVIDTMTNKWKEPNNVDITYPALEAYYNKANSSPTYRAIAMTRAVVENDINGVYVCPPIFSKSYGTDHRTIVLEGETVSAIYNQGNETVSMQYALSAATVSGILSRMGTTSGYDAFNQVSDSLTVSYYTTDVNTITTKTSSTAIRFTINNRTCTAYIFTDDFYSSLVNRGLIYIRSTASTKGVISLAQGNVFQYSLANDESILRFDTTSFPVYTGVYDKPTIPVTELEVRLMRYFNTLTSRTNGFVQFALFDPDRRLIIATVRFDNEVGFTIRGFDQFAQYNGRSIAALVFTDVRFGDRTIATRETDTSSWLSRQGTMFSANVLPETEAPLLYNFNYGHQIPEDVNRGPRKQLFAIRKEMASIKQEMSVLPSTMATLVQLTGKDKDQAAMFALSAAAGGLQGLGAGVGEYLKLKQQTQENQKDRDLHWNTSILTDTRQRDMQGAGFVHDLRMQGNAQTHDQRMANLRAQLERQTYSENRDVDMRNKLAMAGALAPVSQQAQNRNAKGISLASSSSYGGESKA